MESEVGARSHGRRRRKHRRMPQWCGSENSRARGGLSRHIRNAVQPFAGVRHRAPSVRWSCEAAECTQGGRGTLGGRDTRGLNAGFDVPARIPSSTTTLVWYYVSA